ncbi:MAG: CusA/CzcA family heavy metal efflux RND transporter [Bacteroidales bacterium]|nr:CusA/CzcA family heavy metal efflux RND transporter [Bacteroidales bacterium]
MIERIINFSLKNKAIIGLFTLALIAWGIFSLVRLPIDAVPDITNNQVQVISVAPTLAVQEVERFITTPIEVSMANIPDVVELRSISRLGLSVVTIVFEDHVDIYKARMLVGERLKEAEEQIPNGMTKPEMAPVSTGLGEIFQYILHRQPGYEKKYSAMDLRTVQDWIVRREMLGTPGVADVNSYGGFLKQYVVSINPEKLRSMNLTLTDILDALSKNNENTGGAYIDKKPNAYFIRGIGLATSLEDIQRIVVKNKEHGIPVLIRDVATVLFGSAPRYGAFVADTSGEAVGGVVMMLKGANAHQVIENVKDRITIIEKSLPEGVTIQPYLDRTNLVSRSIGTVSKNLIEGGLIVVFVLVLLLGNLRAGLIVASVIPLSMLFAISLMNLFGVSGNLMSLGAIDFGLIVDGAVIIVESVVHRIYMSKTHHQGVIRLTQQQIDDEVLSSSKRMMSSATFGQIIILIVYLPILALVGIEGKMFRPMAEVVSFAIFGALILSLTYVPVASAMFLSKNPVHKPNISDKIMDYIHRGFTPIINIALRSKKWVVIISIIMFIGSMWLFNRLGGEFLPQLNEGDLAAGIMTLQGSSLTNTVETVEKANKILLSNFPEVKQAVCKIGSAEIPTDPTPMETGDYIITLKDEKEWTSAETREELIEKMEKALSILPGVKFEFQQPIQMRFNELMTGSRQDVAIKIFGDNLETLALNASKVERLIQPIQGVQDINVEKVTGLPQIQIEYNRDKIAQYGLNISDINQLVRTAFAGSSAGVIFEEEKRFDLVVRFEKEFRQDLENVKNLYVSLPSGGQINLDQLADVQIKAGPAQISRENTKRRITIGFNVRGRDVESIIKEVRTKIEKSIKLPPGYFVTYGGQFENLVAAKNRLAVAVPVALLLIFVLLFFTFHSFKQTLLIYSAVPLSAIGGVLALWLRDMNFSISAGVGFIALFGVSVLNGIVLIAEFNRLEKDEGIIDIYERVLKGLKTRLRPVVMTAAVASIGFLPMALSTSAGAEVQKPLATVVIGGLISATLLTLIVLPVLYIIFSQRKSRRKINMANPIMLILGVISINLLFTQNANAQQMSPKILTLEKAISIAVDSNLNIRSAGYQVELQRALKGTSWDIGKTDIDIEYGQFNSTNKDNGITISQSFAFPTVYTGQYKLAKANIKSSEIEFSITKNEIVNGVKTTWWKLTYYYSKLRLLRYQDSLYTGFTNAANRRAQTGETNMLEKISAESQSLEVRNLLMQTKADVEIYKKRLQTLLNTRQTISIIDTVLTKLSININADSISFVSNPALASYEQKVEVARLESKVEKSKILPDFKIGYFSQSIIGAQEINGVTHNYTSSDRFTGIQAGISIPLWFYPQAAKIKAAKINHSIAKANAEYSKTALSGEFESLLQEYSKYKNNIDYYEKLALPQADMIINQSTKSYRAGAMDYLAYIQSLSQALLIKNNYLETLNLYNQSVIAIEFLVGKNK